MSNFTPNTNSRKNGNLDIRNLIVSTSELGTHVSCKVWIDCLNEAEKIQTSMLEFVDPKELEDFANRLLSAVKKMNEKKEKKEKETANEYLMESIRENFKF